MLIFLLFILWGMPIISSIIRLSESHPSAPRYRPNFITTAIVIGVAIYLVSNWVGFSQCIGDDPFSWRIRECKRDNLSHGWIIAWSILVAPLAFLVLRAWGSITLHSYRLNAKYGASRAILGTLRNLGIYALWTTGAGLLTLLIGGILTIVGFGLDLDLDLDLDGGDIDFDVGEDFGWQAGAEDVSSGSDTAIENPPLEDVSGYTRSDGTEVSSYVRTKADGIPWNNLSHRS